VVVGGTWSASSLVAGVIAGADGKFGTADDAMLSATGASNRADIFSKISSVIVKGIGSGSSVGTHFGMVAEQIVAAKFNGISVALTAGTDNINQDSTFSIVEVVEAVA
jgi:hypothetical protein